MSLMNDGERIEISNPMLTSSVLEKNKLSFAIQIFVPDCPHCRTIDYIFSTLDNKVNF